MSYASAAREAPPEHGHVAGTMLGAWSILQDVNNILRHLQGQPPQTPQLMPDVQPDIASMAHAAVAIQTRTIGVLQKINEELQKG